MTRRDLRHSTPIARCPTAAVCLLLAGLACSEAPPAERPPAVATPSATLILEPPHLEIGETATLEVAIAVPPGTRVGPVPTPDASPGLWVLGVDGPFAEHSPQRDVYRTRFRIRARETGSFTWPTSQVQITLPGRGEQVLEIPARSFRVHSVLRDVPDQLTFFSYRAPAFLGEGRESTGVVLPALVGAALALAGVALIALVRRARAARDATKLEHVPANTPWLPARAALASATEIAEQDPVRGAFMASAALRSFVDQRFRTRITRATSEELRERKVPFLLTTRWQCLLELLERLDALRFPPLAEDRPAAVNALKSVIEETQAFVADATPRGDAR